MHLRGPSNEYGSLKRPCMILFIKIRVAAVIPNNTRMNNPKLSFGVNFHPFFVPFEES